MMIFTKLELKNFKSHADTVLNINPGISLIVGENGAGKSSIFEAISFALFKTYTTKNITDLVRSNKNLKEKIEMAVKLSFISQGNEYIVERKVVITKSGSSKFYSNLYLVKDGNAEIMVSGNKDVDNNIKEILSMDSSTFLNAIHIRQGEIAELIDKTPADRKKLIGKLLRLEELERAYENLPKVSEEYKTRKAVLEDRIQPESELNFELKKAKDEYFTLNKRNNLLKEEFETLKKEIEVKNKEKEDLDKQKSEFEALQLKLNHENDNLKGLNKFKEALSTKYNEILRNEEQMNRLKPFSDKLPIYNKFKESLLRLNKFKEDDKTNKEILAQIEGFKNTLNDEKENYEKYIVLDGEIKELNNNKVELSSELKRISELEDEKNNITKDIGKYKTELDNFYNDSSVVLSQFEKEIPQIKTNDDLSKIDSIVEDLRTNLRKDIESLSSEIEKLKNKSFSLNQEIKSLDEPLADIRRVENKCPVCQSEISEEKKNELVTMYETTIFNNNKKIDEINEILGKLNKEKSLKEANLTNLNSIKTKIYQNKHIVGDLEKFENNLSFVNTKIIELQGKKEELEELNKILESKNKEFEELQIHYDKYLKADTLLKSFPDETKIKDELYTIFGNIQIESEKLKGYIATDTQLSMDISEEKLNDLIGQLTEKDTKYHVLLGSIKGKEEYEEKIETNSKEIAEKEEEIREIVKAIENSSYNEETYNHMNILLERYNNKFNSSSQEIAVNDNNLKLFEKTIEDMERNIEINMKNKEEFIAVNEYYSLLEDFRSFYSKDGIQGDLRRQSRPLIQKYTRDFFEKFNFNYSDLILDNEYNISIFGPEGESNIDMVSGGEKIAIALALRLGITQAMSEGSIETILLDEPTIHLDSFRRQELIAVLRSMSVIPQMLIVTHDIELENAADTLIRVVKKDGISKVVLNG